MVGGVAHIHVVRCASGASGFCRHCFHAVTLLVPCSSLSVAVVLVVVVSSYTVLALMPGAQ